jgi:arylamine N-acetyltransferase
VEALALDETHARLRVTLDGETWEVAVPLEGMAPPAL